MNQPKYILKTVEKMDVPLDPRGRKMKKVVGIICVIVLVILPLLGINPLEELSPISWCVLLGVASRCLLSTKSVKENFPLEIHFYDDMIEVHRLEVHYSNGKVVRELHRFFLDGNTEVRYTPGSKIVSVTGMAHGEWYPYSRNGQPCTKPKQVVDRKGICVVVLGDENVDIVKEVEEHSPIKVKIERI